LSHLYTRQQADDITDAERADLFEIGEEMNLGVVFEAGFITELAILSYLSQFH